MPIPTTSDWGFQAIHQVNSTRADRLKNAGTPDQLMETLKEELQKARQNGNFRVGVDSRGNQFEENRVIIQFKVKPKTYDWFFNARTGYRAQFWISPENGMDFNKNLVTNLRDTFLENLPPSIPAMKIEFKEYNGLREDHNAGEKIVEYDWIRESLESQITKIWICERLIQQDRASIVSRDLSPLIATPQAPKLEIPRWKFESEEGLLAPYLDSDYSWLDIKGAFIRLNGDLDQIKPQDKRAKSLSEKGWT